MRISIKENLKHLNRIIDNFTKIRKLYKAVGEYMLASVEENFQAQGRPTRWKRLSIETLKSGYKGKKFKKRGGLTKAFGKHVAGKKILIDSGRLKNSITYKVKAIKKLQDTKIYVGTNVVYAAIHQYGGYAGRNRKVYIPARPYLLMQEQDRVWISSLFRKELWEKER